MLAYSTAESCRVLCHSNRQIEQHSLTARLWIAMATGPDCRSQCEVSVSMEMDQLNGNPSLFMHCRKRAGRVGVGVVSMCVSDHVCRSPVLPPRLLIANLQSCTTYQLGTRERLKGDYELEQKLGHANSWHFTTLLHNQLQETG